MTALENRPRTALLVIEDVPVLRVQHSDENVPRGAQTEECIRSTLHGALVRGYDVTLVSDAHTTEDIREWGFPVTPEQSIAYTNAYWSWAAAPGRKGGVAATAEVDFSGVCAQLRRSEPGPTC